MSAMDIEIVSDTLSEVGTISMGSAATALSTILSRRVDITAPEVEITTPRDIQENMTVPIVIATVQYHEGFAGENFLILQEGDAAKIATIMMGMPQEQAPDQLGEMELSAVSEAMNQMMGMASTALSDLFGRMIDISPPEVNRVDLAEEASTLGHMDVDDTVALVRFDLQIEDLLESTMAQMVPLAFAEQMNKDLMAAMTGLGWQPAPEATPQPVKESSAEIPPVPQPASPKARPGALGILEDVPVRLKAVLGRTSVPLKDVINLRDGVVIQLERAAGEPIEILADDHLVGWGQVITVGDRFGIRIAALRESEIADMGSQSLESGGR